MSITVKIFQPTDTPAWDTYVHSHPRATLYHLSGWKNVIEKTYGHKTYYLMATNSSKLPDGINTTTFHRAGKAQSSKKDTTTAHQLSAIGSELPSRIQHPASSIQEIVGILPLVHLKREDADR